MRADTETNAVTKTKLILPECNEVPVQAKFVRLIPHTLVSIRCRETSLNLRIDRDFLTMQGHWSGIGAENSHNRRVEPQRFFECNFNQ